MKNLAFMVKCCKWWYNRKYKVQKGSVDNDN